MANAEGSPKVRSLTTPSGLLDETIETIAQGVAVFDAEARLLAFNSQFVSFFEFPPDFLRIGMPIAEIIRNRAERGLYGEGKDPEELVRHHVERAKIRTERSEERSLASGKAYIYHRKPMSNGGFVITYTDITDRKEVEQKLRASEEKFRGAFNNAGIGLVIRNADGKGREFNGAMCEMLGYSQEELQSMRLREIAHPDDDPETTSMRFVAFGSRDSRTVERRFIRKDGRVIWCNINYKSVYDADGRPLSTIGMYQDITERKRAERDAAEKSRVLEGTFSNMVQGIAVYNRNHAVVAFNPQYAEILNLPPDFLHIGKTRREIIRYRSEHGDYGGTCSEAEMEEKLATACQPETGERILPNGRAYAYERTPTPDGGYISTVTDITDRREADTLSQRLGRILDSSFNEIYVFDAETYRFIQISRGALNNLGYERDEMNRLTPWDLKPKFNEKSFKAAVEPLLRGEEEMLVFDTEHMRKDGSLYPVEVRLQMSRTESPPVFVAIVADISERKQAEKAVDDARKKAEAANQAKSEFLANVSHELRTPLNAIIGFSEVMMQDNFDPSKGGGYLEFIEGIHTAGNHLLGLINDILDLSKIEAGKTELNEEDLNPLSVIGSCVDMVKGEADKHGIRLIEDYPEEIAPLRADQRMLRQIFLNLLSNAVKFTPKGGGVTVKAWCEPGNGHGFQVIDSGIGVAPEDIPKILRPFNQIDSKLSRRYQGTGLGLTLAKNLIELHGGYLDFQSEPGAGSTVTVQFPKDRIAAAPARAADTAKSQECL